VFKRIGVILKLASYTYGPLLGLFAFGIPTGRALNDCLVPVVTIGALLEFYQEFLLGRSRLGLELLMVNGISVFAGLWAISHSQKLDVVVAPA